MRLLLCLACATVQARRLTIRAGTVLDGRGIAHDQQIVIDSGKIVSVGPATQHLHPHYDLSALTLMPGWIDTHVRLQSHMDASHKAIAGGALPEDMALFHVPPRK